MLEKIELVTEPNYFPQVIQEENGGRGLKNMTEENLGEWNLPFIKWLAWHCIIILEGCQKVVRKFREQKARMNSPEDNMEDCLNRWPELT